MSSTQDLCDASATLAGALATFGAAHPTLADDPHWHELRRAVVYAQVKMAWKEGMTVAEMLEQGGDASGGLGEHWDAPRPGFGAEYE